MCPLFHVASNRLRLLCTYAGPGTEWLEPLDADRRQLGLRGRSLKTANAAIARGPIRCLKTGSVAIIKGGEFGDDEHEGLVHRSPEPARERRLLLAVDPLEGEGQPPEPRRSRRPRREACP